MARLDGVRNLAAYFAHNAIPPDLGRAPHSLLFYTTEKTPLIGPKMYNAYGSVQDDRHNGSTKLHMDLTDAVNIMIWAAENHGEPGYAVWHIFPAVTSSTLRTFLRDDVGITGPGDPIHSQTIYMTPAMLERLFVKHAIRPYTIRQRPGEAVFIPAGCPHQVGFFIFHLFLPLSLRLG
jgi:hypothetical protein